MPGWLEGPWCPALQLWHSKQARHGAALTLAAGISKLATGGHAGLGFLPVVACP